MHSALPAIAAFLTTAVSSQSYGSGSGSGSGSASPVSSGCPTQFAITSFSASCARHGIGCQFSFAVATNASLGAPPARCGASFPDAAVELPVVPYTLCTQDRAVVWGWAPIGPPNGSATDYSLIVTDAALGLRAVKFWGAADFPMATAGASVFQNYTGEANFDI